MCVYIALMLFYYDVKNVREREKKRRQMVWKNQMKKSEMNETRMKTYFALSATSLALHSLLVVWIVSGNKNYFFLSLFSIITLHHSVLVMMIEGISSAIQSHVTLVKKTCVIIFTIIDWEISLGAHNFFLMLSPINSIFNYY